MTEREIDNRGSKSIIQVSECIIVKEQRVDGSWQLASANCLRCILTGLEIKNKVKVPVKQINKVRFHTLVSNQTQELILNP